MNRLTDTLKTHFLYAARPWFYMSTGLYALFALRSSEIACVCGTVLTVVAFALIYMRNNGQSDRHERLKF